MFILMSVQGRPSKGGRKEQVPLWNIVIAFESALFRALFIEVDVFLFYKKNNFIDYCLNNIYNNNIINLSYVR